MAKKQDRKHLQMVADNLAVGFLETVVFYLMSSNLSINRRSMRRVKEFFELFEPDDFARSRDREVRFHLIQRLAAARVDKRLDDPNNILQACLDGSSYDDEVNAVFDEFDEIGEIGNDDVNFVDETIAARLKFANFSNVAGRLQDVVIRYQNNEFRNLMTFMEEELSPVVAEANAELRRVQVSGKESALDFDMSRESLMNIYTHTIDVRNRGGSCITTGVQMLNEMLGGNGFEAPRVYTALGASGKWKSGFLFNASMWSKKYNANTECMDPTKKPCTLFMNLENDNPETAERMLSYVVNDGDMQHADVREWDASDLVDQIVDEGVGHEDDSEDYQIFYRYKSNRSIDANDIEGIIEELAEDGYEVRFLIIDYLRRLNSVTRETEERFRLASIVDQLKTLAIAHCIPVLTAAQLNRTAMAIIEEMSEKGHGNIGQKLMSSQIGEAWGIMENSDMCIIGNPETVITGRKEIKYYTFKRCKMRGREKGPSYFAHPYVSGNDMRLIEDIDEAKPLSEMNLKDSFPDAASLPSDDASDPSSNIVSRKKNKMVKGREQKEKPPKKKKEQNGVVDGFLGENEGKFLLPEEK